MAFFCCCQGLGWEVRKKLWPSTFTPKILNFGEPELLSEPDASDKTSLQKNAHIWSVLHRVRWGEMGS